MQLGTHILLDAIYTGDLDLDTVLECFDDICDEHEMTVLHRYHHLFEPQGLTCVYTLSESHMSIHTWPEHKRFCMDLFTCSKEVNVKKIVTTLQEELQVVKSSVRILTREIMHT
jgi:S-adenosylmethionine decarboxylase proenzyme